MKKTTLLLIVILILVPLVFSEEPTYEQTRKWIVSKISDEAGRTIRVGDFMYMTETYEQVSMDDCKLQFTFVLFSSGIAKVSSSSLTRSAVTIPLDKVVSVEHVPSGQNVRITTSMKAILVKTTEKETGHDAVSVPREPMDAESISFDRSATTDEHLADRMQKALSRAVSLCTKTKEKEPF